MHAHKKRLSKGRGRHDPGFKPFVCPKCGTRFRSTIGRKLHLEESHGVFEDARPKQIYP